MANDLTAALRNATKGTGWTVRWDLVCMRAEGWAFAVLPCRRAPRLLEFHAKPLAWDHLLWLVLQSTGNERRPASFHFSGAFTCATPALAAETYDNKAAPAAIAEQMIALARTCHSRTTLWQGHDLRVAIEAEQPQAAHAYHITRVIERIVSGDRTGAQAICEAAIAGKLDMRGDFMSPDLLVPPDALGRRPVISFFELAELWMRRN